MLVVGILMLRCPREGLGLGLRVRLWGLFCDELVGVWHFRLVVVCCVVVCRYYTMLRCGYNVLVSGLGCGFGWDFIEFGFGLVGVGCVCMVVLVLRCPRVEVPLCFVDVVSACQFWGLALVWFSGYFSLLERYSRNFGLRDWWRVDII